MVNIWIDGFLYRFCFVFSFPFFCCQYCYWSFNVVKRRQKARANRHYHSNFPEYSIISRYLYFFFRVFRALCVCVCAMWAEKISLFHISYTINMEIVVCSSARFIYLFIILIFFSHVVVSKNIHRHFKDIQYLVSKVKCRAMIHRAWIHTRGDNGSTDGGITASMNFVHTHTNIKYKK